MFIAFRSYPHAFFIVDILANLTRALQFCAALVEESVLPLLLHVLDCHPADELVEKVAEALMNMSNLRRNRREIASCGVSSHLERLVHSNLLLLTVGYFHA
jgi:hypothetical protein